MTLTLYNMGEVGDHGMTLYNRGEVGDHDFVQRGGGVGVTMTLYNRER